MNGVTGLFKVRFVDDDALPAEQLWVIGVDDRTGERFLFMKSGAALCPTAWEAVWRYGQALDTPGLRVAV